MQASSEVSTFEEEVKRGDRYRFGKNWASFLSALTPERIEIAERSLRDMLGVEHLTGKSFADVGSGSGLFSLAARKLGATVCSFDYDPDSVSCTTKLRDTFFPEDEAWTIQRGSVLDQGFVSSLGTFDIVYSWGVLHHTGNMWQAIRNITPLARHNGAICIAIYNDQGRTSRIWRRAKKLYCSGTVGRTAVLCVYSPYFVVKQGLLSLYRRTNTFANYKVQRGMSMIHDMFDWLGGYPFEVATVDEIFHYFKGEGFDLDNIKTTRSNGNNQFVFAKR